MPLDIMRKNIVREKDGQLTLNVAFIETNSGVVLHTATVQGANAAELKSELGPIIVTVRDKYLADQQLQAAADAGLVDLKTDYGLPAGT